MKVPVTIVPTLALYCVTTNCCSHTIIIIMQKAQDKPGVYVIHHPRLCRVPDEASPKGVYSTDKMHPKGSSSNKTRLKLPKLVV